MADLYTARAQEFALRIMPGQSEKLHVDGNVLAMRQGPDDGIEVLLTGKSFVIIPGMTVRFDARFSLLTFRNNLQDIAELNVIVGQGDINLPERETKTIIVPPPIEVQNSKTVIVASGATTNIKENEFGNWSRVLSARVSNSGKRGVELHSAAGANIIDYLLPYETKVFDDFPRNPNQQNEILFAIFNPNLFATVSEPASRVSVTLTGIL